MIDSILTRTGRRICRGGLSVEASSNLLAHSCQKRALLHYWERRTTCMAERRSQTLGTILESRFLVFKAVQTINSQKLNFGAFSRLIYRDRPQATAQSRTTSVAKAIPRGLLRPSPPRLQHLISSIACVQTPTFSSFIKLFQLLCELNMKSYRRSVRVDASNQRKF